jgi:hypothetical protein
LAISLSAGDEQHGQPAVPCTSLDVRQSLAAIGLATIAIFETFGKFVIPLNRCLGCLDGTTSLIHLQSLKVVAVLGEKSAEVFLDL